MSNPALYSFTDVPGRSELVLELDDSEQARQSGLNLAYLRRMLRGEDEGFLTDVATGVPHPVSLTQWADLDPETTFSGWKPFLPGAAHQARTRASLSR